MKQVTRRSGIFSMVLAGLAVAMTTGPTALMSAAINVAPPGRTLYVTNGTSATIRIFTIDREGTLSPLGPLVDTGDNPRGIALSADGRIAYVAAADTEARPSGVVWAYSVLDDGGLDLLDTYKTGGDFPFGIALAPGGQTLYVVNTASHTISAFTIALDGRLSVLGQPVPTGAVNPRGMSITPDGRYMFVTHDNLQNTELDPVIGFAIASDGSLVPLESPAVSPCAGGFGTALAPNGQFLYLSCLHSGQVAGFRITNEGALTPVPSSPFKVGAGPEGIAITPDSRQLYLSHVGETRPDRQRAVSAFTITPDGELLPVSRRPFTAGRGPSGITTTPDARHLYVANFDDGTVSAFGIKREGSLLTIGTFPTGGTNPGFQSVAVRPNQGPTAAFSAKIAPAGDSSRFDASASADPDGRIVRYHWDFGDGTAEPDGGPRPKHTYQRPGTFTITLMVIDDEDCSTTVVYTGQKALCNGSARAEATRTVTVQARFPDTARSNAPMAVPGEGVLRPQACFNVANHVLRDSNAF